MPLITRAIIDARFAPRVGRQMRLDLRKLRFRQPKLVATHLCLLFGSRESRHYVRANTFMGPDPNSAWSKRQLRLESLQYNFCTDGREAAAARIKLSRSGL